MTRPSEIKPREGEQPAALYKDWQVGATFDPLPFTVTPDIVREYMSVVDADPKNYVIDGRAAAPSNVLFVYMMAVMYRRYPPQQGGIMIGNTVEFHNPIWADESTDVIGSGRVTNKFEKKGRKYICYDVNFKRPDGTLLMSVSHTSCFPE
jgi:acyl dehydratase